MNKVPLMYLSQKTARVCEECFNTLANDGKKLDIILVHATELSEGRVQKTFMLGTRQARQKLVLAL